MMMDILHSKIFLLALTVGVYYGSTLLYDRFRMALFNPLLVSIAVIIAVLHWIGVDYSVYYDANSIVNFMLGLSVVALGWLLDRNIDQLKGKVLSIMASVFAGSLVAILSIVGIATLLRADQVVVASLQPKSVTTPIAIMISENSGGIPALTSIAVIITGILGSIVGPWLMRVTGIRDSVARGLALGSASHAVGTAKAMELGAVEGAVGGAAIGLMGLATAFMIPVVEWLIALL